MHDTAYTIGGLVLQTYCPADQARILEIGSYSVNGGLRDLAPRAAEYLGLDVTAGPGVDRVIVPNKPFPVPDDHFDLVLASSVFEHDSAFWVTFLEMCRKARPGGYIYISAPSNGAVHRYPRDNWRFYPDSGRALADWAVSQGQDIRLVESFIADRAQDIWNDFAAIFQKEPGDEALPTDFVHRRIACANINTWQSDGLIDARDATEDMMLIAASQETVTRLQNDVAPRVPALEQERDALTAERTALMRRLAEMDSALLQQQAEAAGLREQAQAAEALAVERTSLTHRLAEMDSALLQRQAETANAWAELQAERDARAVAEAAAEAAAAAQASKLSDANDWVFTLSAARQELEAETQRQARRIEQADIARRTAEAEAERLRRQHVSLESRVKSARAASEAYEAKLADRFREIAALSELTIKEQDRAARQTARVDWLRQVHATMAGAPRWWLLLPASWRRRRDHLRLKQKGLFDAAAYLSRYPDVAAARLDPLQHYIRHGIVEGRKID